MEGCPARWEGAEQNREEKERLLGKESNSTLSETSLSIST